MIYYTIYDTINLYLIFHFFTMNAKKIVSDEDFEKYTDNYQNYRDTQNLVTRIASAIRTQLKTLDAYDILDSLN